MAAARQQVVELMFSRSTSFFFLFKKLLMGTEEKYPILVDF